jgi:hypothetical protein
MHADRSCYESGLLFYTKPGWAGFLAIIAVRGFHGELLRSSGCIDCVGVEPCLQRRRSRMLFLY